VVIVNGLIEDGGTFFRKFHILQSINSFAKLNNLLVTTNFLGENDVKRRLFLHK
jgi:hypothetical protein